MHFDGCFCTACLRPITERDAEPWITVGLCMACRQMGRPGVLLLKADLTADELEYARRHRFPVHVQPMVKRSRAEARRPIYTDVEEFSRPALEERVRVLMKRGWSQSGAYFVRATPAVLTQARSERESATPPPTHPRSA